MEYFIGIAPPERYSEQINKLREKWSYVATEPHITLKGPRGLNNDNDWLRKVKKVIERSEAFDISIGGIDYFSDSVLFYQVSSQKIHDLHKRLVDAVTPTNEEIKSDFELDEYVPHLTIMKHKTGYLDLPLNQIAWESTKGFKKYFCFKVRSIGIYARNHKYENFDKVLDLPLYSKQF